VNPVEEMRREGHEEADRLQVGTWFSAKELTILPARTDSSVTTAPYGAIRHPGQRQASWPARHRVARD